MATFNKQVTQGESETEVLSPTRLVELYDVVVEDLRQCASIDPKFESEISDQREADLLGFEANLLNQAARVKIITQEDVEALMDIWAKASCIQSTEDVRPSDRIAMNLFRHMSGAQFSQA